MLSILIPSFNFDISKLIKEFHFQAIEMKIAFEIIIIDDASDEKYRKISSKLSSLKNVKFIQLEKNIGRSKIRNLLAEKANFPYLIFADSDTLIKKKDFVKSYINSCKDAEIVFGGIAYSKEPPKDKSQYLRWFYGTQREQISAEIRKKMDNRLFMTGNFLISKKVFEKIKFDEEITQYGHEDTVFAYEAMQNNIKIKHIDNPLIHIGLETSEKFIEKTKVAVKNLKAIAETDKYQELFATIRLWRVYKKIKLIRFFIKVLYHITKKIIERNLKGEYPKLSYFDFYKLGYLCSIKK